MKSGSRVKVDDFLDEEIDILVPPDLLEDYPVDTFKVADNLGDGDYFRGIKVRGKVVFPGIAITENVGDNRFSCGPYQITHIQTGRSLDHRFSFKDLQTAKVVAELISKLEINGKPVDYPTLQLGGDYTRLVGMAIKLIVLEYGIDPFAEEGS